MDDRYSQNQPYCICRSYDGTRFMICCDNCNQWFHGDCVRIKAEDAKKIFRFYCPPCQKSNPSLHTVYRSTPSSPGTSSPRPSFGLPPSASAPALSSKGSGIGSPVVPEKRSFPTEMTPKLTDFSTKRAKMTTSFSDSLFNCGNCIGCFRKESCGRCEICRNEGTTDQICLLRRCVNVNLSPSVQRKPILIDSDTDTDKEDQYVERERKRRGPYNKTSAKLKNVSVRKEGGGRVGRPPKQKPIDSPSSNTNSGGTRASARAYRNFLKDAGVLPNSDDDGGKRKKPAQCYGPGCIFAARHQSKYCSDECGMNVARKRLETYLPSRLNQFYSKRPVAEEFEQRRLERIHADHETGRIRLTDLDNEEKELNAWRDKCKTIRSRENDGGKSSKSKSKQKETDDSETNVYCATCGNETTMKNALKHFAKCFSKYESQTSYGSSFKAVNNLYNIFCDTYNKANRTYCKRLRVICPEHSKEEKVDSHEICGCPLQPDKPFRVDDFDLSAVCTTLKKNCNKHYRWMQIRRALIDMERLSQLLRLEELAEETRCIQVAQHNRGNIVALLLHQSISHEAPKVEEKREEPEKVGDTENDFDRTAVKEKNENEENGEVRQNELDQQFGRNDENRDVGQNEKNRDGVEQNGKEFPETETNGTDGEKEGQTPTGTGSDDQKTEETKADVVPKYAEPNSMRTALEAGWRGVYGDSE